MKEFRLIGVKRPTDLSKNRWNFIFTNDLETDTNLEVATAATMLDKGGKGIIKIDIYQTGDAPLYGFVVYFDNDST